MKTVLGTPPTGLRRKTLTNNTRNSSGDETANVNFLYDDIAHVLQSTAPPPQTAQHGVVTERTQKHQPEAKRQNITARNIDDKFNESNVNRVTDSVHPRMG